MRTRRLCLAIGVAVCPACEQEIDIEVQWLTWLSYREIEAVAPMPDGGLAIAGRSVSDEGRARIGFGQSTFRPFAARLGADGTPVWTELGFLGAASAISAGEDGVVYVLTSAHEQLDGHACDLVAHAPDGTVQWTRPIVADEGCPRSLLAFDDRIVIGRWHAIDILDFEGTPVARMEVDDGARIERLAASTVDLWAFGARASIDGEEGVAWHLGAGTRQLDTVALEQSDGWAHVAAASVREDGVDMVQIHRDPDDISHPVRADVRFAAYGDDGHLLRTVDLSKASGPVVAILPGAGGGRWLVGSTSAEAPPLDDPDELSSSGRIWLRHLGPRDGLGPEATRWFAEPAVDAPERVDCISSDVGPHEVHGTRATFAFSRADGTLVLAGEQHCRDAWVAAFEVR